MENWFQNDKKKIVSIEEKNELARSLNLTTKQVSFWIHYRSKKEKQNKMGITETKKRRRINKECKKLLLNYFTNTSYSPSSVEIKILSNRTNLTERKINYWFEKKRLSIQN